MSSSKRGTSPLPPNAQRNMTSSTTSSTSSRKGGNGGQSDGKYSGKVNVNKQGTSLPQSRSSTSSTTTHHSDGPGANNVSLQNNQSIAKPTEPPVKGAESTSSGSVKRNFCVSSDEINFLVYRYLQESGFVHTAFTFAYESLLGRSNVAKTHAADVPPGALVSFLQKGLQYLGIEEHLNEDGSEGPLPAASARPNLKRKHGTGNSQHVNGNVKSEDDVRSMNTNVDVDKSYDFSLLSPHVCRALTRREPPIQLNIPSAVATAAAKARAKELSGKSNSNSSRSEARTSNELSSLPVTMQLTEAKGSGLSNSTGPLISKKPKMNGNSSKSAAGAQTSSVTSVVEHAKIVASLNVVNPSKSSTLSTSSGGSSGNPASQTGKSRNSNAKASVGSTGNENINNTLSSTLTSMHSSSSSSQPQSAMTNTSSKLSKRQKKQLNQNQLVSSNSTLSSTNANVLKGGNGGGQKSSYANSIASANATTGHQQNSSAGGVPHQHLMTSNNFGVINTSKPSSMKSADSISSALTNAVAAAARAAASNRSSLATDKTSIDAAYSRLKNQQHASMKPESENLAPAVAPNTSLTANMKPQKISSLGAQFGAIGGMASLSSGTMVNGSHHDAISGGKNGGAFSGQMLPSGNNGESSMHQSRLVPIQYPGQSSSTAQATPSTQALHMSLDDDASTRALPSEVLDLSQHTSEVFMCAWNPVFTDLIATGSGDASARIWQMSGPTAKFGSGASRLLQHGSAGDRNKDVTTLEWSSDGQHLATGSYDGVARVWHRTGDLVHVLRGHRGPIFSLKWNKRGNFLLSGSYDKTTIVWDVSGKVGFVRQQFDDHLAPALDVDWKDDTTFASCSTDKSVHICRVGTQRPLQTYTGHTDEVNAVKWNPSGTLLASCSDDCTAKVWDVTRGKNEPLYDFKSHQQEIYTVKWSPTGPGSSNPSKPLMLATASFDGSVRLWNVQDGTCIRGLSRHKDSVYSVAFSPSGEYLASGSLAGQLYVWNVREGKHIKSFKGRGDIFEVAWNAEESRVAACFSSNIVSVIDFHS